MISIGFTGFSLACIAYFIFTFVVFASRTKMMLARCVLLCALLTVVVSGLSVAQLNYSFSILFIFVIDSVRVAFWAIFIFSCNIETNSFSQIYKNNNVRRYLFGWLVLNIAIYIAVFVMSASEVYFYLLFLLMNLWTLVLLEQLYRNADSTMKSSMLPLIVAIGSMSIFDFGMFSQAFLVNQLDSFLWSIRGYVLLFSIPFLLVGLRRIKNGVVRVFISRGVVFYSSMLLIGGVYLLVMALAGYLLSYFSSEWGGIISFIFMLFGGVFLVAIFITEAFRRKVKVFIAKNFFANKYEYRNEWLDLIEKIEMSSSGSYYELATQVMISKVDALGGVIIRQTAQDQFEEKFSIGVKLDQQFYEDLMLLCHFCDKNRWIVDIHEYNLDANAYPGLFLHPQTWENSNVNIIVPISIGKKFYGLFLLARGHEKSPLNWEDRDLLFAVSKQLSNFISLNEANEKIAESKQFDAFNRMSAFLVHDLKNVQAQLALITTNAEKHRDNPEFVDDVFDTVESATGRLEKVLSQLRKKQVEQRMDNYASLSSIIEKVIAQSNVQLPCVHFEFKGDGNTTIDSESFTSVIHHLIQNAQEATDKSGWVKVILNDNPQTIGITIEDNGCGMSEEFINTRLFKPFDTTKGNAGMGIGVFEAKQFFESVSGTITVKSKEGSGTLFSISLPKVNNLDDQ